MKYIVDGKKMKEIDRYTIEEIGIPSMVLMERAALSVVQAAKLHINQKDNILCVCGNGNNGGDGIAIGRILAEEGYLVTILWLGEEAKASEETKKQLAIAKKMGIFICNKVKLSEYTIIIDAIFGIGLSRPVLGSYKKIISQINETEAFIISVDIPSGIDSECGKIMQIAIKADITVTFGYAKQGLLLYPGAEYAGQVIVADIGFSHKALEQADLDMFYYEEEDLRRLPIRKRYSNKGTFGKVLVIAGSKNMSGACYLSAKAAYRTGAGLVKIVTVEENREILQTNLPEAVLLTYSSTKLEERIDFIIEEIKAATAIIIGPGIGKEQAAEILLDGVLQYAKVPVVVDADALNLLASNTKYVHKKKKASCCNQIQLPSNIILTPHVKEMSRLLGIEVDRIQEDIVKIAKESVTTSFTLALKDARTIVTNGTKGYLNLAGNHGMATGGAGDVLTGVIAALLAQGMEPFEATTLGVYLHSLAGDKAVRTKGTYGLMAQDLMEALPQVMK